MNPLECKACFEEYHPTSRRPRALPCGHSYCEPCLGILKANQMIKCPTCRREHNVTDVTELMIVYDLIELLDSKQPTAKVSISKGECDEHGCPLNFYCVTHKEWICRDCTVLEHTKEKCSIRTKNKFVQEKVAKEKEKLISEKETQEKCQSSLMKNCDEIKKEIITHEELITKLQSLLNSHVNKKANLDMKLKSIENIITEFAVNNNELINMIPSISSMTDFSDLEVAWKKSEELICKVQHWREDKMKKYPKKLDTSSDKIKLPLAELIKLSLTYINPDNTVHTGFTCDECNTEDFQGVRYCCLVCNMVDICEGCENMGLHDVLHAKLKVPKLVTWLDKIHADQPIDTVTLPGGSWYMIFDLKTSYTLSMIRVHKIEDAKHDVKKFKVESSTDKENWSSVRDIFVVENYTENIKDFGYFYASGRYWKITILGDLEDIYAPAKLAFMGYEN